MPLDPEIKRLRKLSPAALADEAGALKAKTEAGFRHLRERIRGSVHQRHTHRLGDEVHPAEGAADGRAGAGRAAAGEGTPGGVAACDLNSRACFE